ncbi:hypothetical protein BIY26_09525 [Brenneria goodwinii]|uniref:Uncharacterized protein n=1 Tax=Brenneria goodwinii TaxID=1109412 RepID=A0A250B967_9GAMM|nr:hypothetical protein [Brenneria goodwinii]ATA22626.1 hypothetical protein AWC36_00010 [Brenneria goodwinii]ATA26815.1 hypothetical protein AWC36_23420 [Brenneria goodwinii]RLM25248.1 hypothetical protein BIY26_09525 [Brenneria goodwinii]
MQEKFVIKNTAGLYIGNMIIGTDVTFVLKLELAKTFANDVAANDFIEKSGLADVEVKKVNVITTIEEV